MMMRPRIGRRFKDVPKFWRRRSYSGVVQGEVTPFKPFLHRFPTPYKSSNSTGALFYAVKRGPAHIIVLSSYSAYGIFFLHKSKWFHDVNLLLWVNRQTGEKQLQRNYITYPNNDDEPIRNLLIVESSIDVYYWKLWWNSCIHIAVAFTMRFDRNCRNWNFMLMMLQGSIPHNGIGCKRSLHEWTGM